MRIGLATAITSSVMGKIPKTEAVKTQDVLNILERLKERLAYREDMDIESDLSETMKFTSSLGYASTTPAAIPMAMSRLSGLLTQPPDRELEQTIVTQVTEAIKALIVRNRDFVAGLDMKMGGLEQEIAEQEGRLGGLKAGLKDKDVKDKPTEAKEALEEVENIRRKIKELDNKLNFNKILCRLAEMQIISGINCLSVWLEKMGISIGAGSEYANATLDYRKELKNEATDTFGFLTTKESKASPATIARAYASIDRFMVGFGDPNILSHEERVAHIHEEFERQIEKMLDTGAKSADSSKLVLEFVELTRVAEIAGIPEAQIDSALTNIYPKIRDAYIKLAEDSIQKKKFDEAGQSIDSALSIDKKILPEGSAEFVPLVASLDEKIIEGEIGAFAEHARYASNNSGLRLSTSPRWDQKLGFTVDDKEASIGYMRSAGEALGQLQSSTGAHKRLTGFFAETGSSIVSELIKQASMKKGNEMCVVANGEQTLSCGEYFLLSFARELIGLSGNSPGVPSFDPNGSFERSIP